MRVSTCPMLSRMSCNSKVTGNDVFKLASRPKKISKRVNFNVQSLNRVDKPRHKLLDCKIRNDSTQIINALSNKQPELSSQFKENYKNESNIGPSCLSITIQPHGQKEIIKPDIQKKPVKTSTNLYKPYLVETQPEYIGFESKSKSLQQIKDINKKFNIVLDNSNQSKPVPRTKSHFSPIRLCDENKFLKEVGKKIRPPREAQKLTKSSVIRKSRNKYFTDLIICDCRKNDTLVNDLHSKTTASKEHRVPPHTSSFTSVRNSKENFKKNSKHYYSNNSGESFNKSNKNVTCHCDCNSQRHLNICEKDLLSFSDDELSIDEDEKTFQNCPCPLHNVIKFRHENFPITHASPVKENSTSPMYQTYILDDRLFPVLIHSNQNEDERNDINDPKVVSSTMLNNMKSFVTLKPAVKDPTLLHGTSSQELKFSKYLAGNFQNKTGETVGRGVQLIPTPTNSLALKHQRGVK